MKIVQKSENLTRKQIYDMTTSPAVQKMKSKNKLNSIYGMSAQDPVKDRLLYIDADQMLRPEGRPVADLLDRSNRKAFLAYQWGVYVDTDSVKYIGDIDWTEYNASRRADSEKNGAVAHDLFLMIR